MVLLRKKKGRSGSERPCSLTCLFVDLLVAITVPASNRQDPSYSLRLPTRRADPWPLSAPDVPLRGPFLPEPTLRASATGRSFALHYQHEGSSRRVLRQLSAPLP